jgi:hypothetical protein
VSGKGEGEGYGTARADAERNRMEVLILEALEEQPAVLEELCQGAGRSGQLWVQQQWSWCGRSRREWRRADCHSLSGDDQSREGASRWGSGWGWRELVEVEGLGAASEPKRIVSERWGRCLLGEGWEGLLEREILKMQADSTVLMARPGAMVVFKSSLAQRPSHTMCE